MRVSRRQAPRAATTLAGALLLVGALVSGGGVAIPASHATIHLADDPAQAAIAASEPLELVVAPNDPVLSASKTETRFRILLRNSGERSVPEGSIELSIGDRLVTGNMSERPALPNTDSDSDEESSPDDTAAPQIIATETIGATASESLHEITVTVRTEDLPFTPTSDRGVYALYAHYVPSDASDTDESATLSAFSPVVWEGTNEPSSTVDLSLIVPFVFPADVLSMPTRPQLADAAPRFDSLLDYATEVQAVLAIDPRILAAIRGYGAEAPQSAQDFLAKLESSSLTSFLLQYGDADPAAQTAIGGTELLEPTGFEFITRFGAWEVGETGPSQGSAADVDGSGSAADSNDADANDTDSSTESSPTPSASDTTVTSDASGNDAGNDAASLPGLVFDPATGLPTTASLGAWPDGLAAAWPAPGQVSGATISFLQRHGLDVTVLSSANVSLRGGPAAKIDGGQSIVTDAELDSAVALALHGTTDAHRALGVARATARLAHAADAGVEGLVLGVDRGGVAETETPQALLTALTDRSFVRTVALDKQQTGVATLRGVQPDDERLLILQTAIINEAYVLEARPLLVHPEYLDSYQRLRLLTFLGTRYAAPDSEFLTAAKQYAKRDSELHDGVRLIDTKHTQLVGGSSRIPVQLRNSLPFDVAVHLAVEPSNAALSVTERTFSNVELPEDSSDRVLVPVEARVSSGEASLLLTLTSVDGEFTASTAELPISISTSIEILATILLALAALLLFTFGILRSVRRRRKASLNTDHAALTEPAAAHSGIGE